MPHGTECTGESDLFGPPPFWPAGSAVRRFLCFFGGGWGGGEGRWHWALRVELQGLCLLGCHGWGTAGSSGGRRHTSYSYTWWAPTIALRIRVVRPSKRRTLTLTVFTWLRSRFNYFLKLAFLAQTSKSHLLRGQKSCNLGFKVVKLATKDLSSGLCSTMPV